MIMPFLRLVLIYVVVAAAAVVFFNRDSVLPMIGWPWFGSESAEVAQDDPQSTEQETALETAQDSTESDADAAAPEAQPTETASAQPVQQPVANSIVEPTPAAPAPTASTPAQTSATPPKTAPETAPDTTSDTAPKPAPTPAADLETMRNEARQAYWSGDRAKTEKLYKAMAAANPENVDILGELGNLYFSQRRYDEAGTYYYMAAKQLISGGNTQKAMGLINVLHSIAPAKASELRALAAAKP